MILASLQDDNAEERLVIVSGESYRLASMETMRIASQSGALPEPVGPEYELANARLGPVMARAPGFLDASAYVNHVALVRQARGAVMPESFWTDPLMYQGCSDPFLGPEAMIPSRPEWGTDFEGEIAVITKHVPAGCSTEDAGQYVYAVTLLNDVSLRGLIPDELAKGFGFVQSKPPSALAPFARTPETLPGWTDGVLAATMEVTLNGVAFGALATQDDMTFDFGTLIAHAAKTRPLPAGTVIGSGTISNRDADGGPGKTMTEGGRGYACIAEQRMVETIRSGAARTQFLRHGDVVSMRVTVGGEDLFGTITQTVSEDF